MSVYSSVIPVQRKHRIIAFASQNRLVFGVDFWYNWNEKSVTQRNMKNTNNNQQILHQKFKQLGKSRHKITYKLLALIPEIYEKKIFCKHKCATIYEYAGKYAGLPKSVVKKTLELEKYLEEKPMLKKTIAEVGVHKISIVASLATPETDAIWAKRVRIMSKDALQMLCKELRMKEKVQRDEIIEKQQAVADFGQERPFKTSGDSWQQDQLEQSEHSRQLSVSNNEKVQPQTTFCQAASTKVKIELDHQAQILFNKLKKKIEKSNEKLSNRDALKKMLEMLDELEANKRQVNKKLGRKNESENEGSEKGKSLTKSQKIDSLKNNFKKTSKPKTEPQTEILEDFTTRYIPVAQKRAVSNKTNGVCAYPNCNKAIDLDHHTNRFYDSKNHDSLIGLCKEHHEYMHNGLVVNECEAPSKWQINITQLPKLKADLLYQKYRKLKV